MFVISNTGIVRVSEYTDEFITCLDDAFGFKFEAYKQAFKGTTHHLRWNSIVLYSDELASCIIARKSVGPNMRKINDVPEIHEWAREQRLLIHRIVPCEDVARMVWSFVI